VLSGTEVKALRQGKASLVDGWAQIVDGEMWMESVHIPEYTQGTWTNHATRRKRKLLLHRTEIIKISHRIKDGGYTLVPLKIYFLDGRAKVELAIAKGKKDYDKRQTLREKEDKREAERAMKSKRMRGE
jgi:SsrA-binding protein